VQQSEHQAKVEGHIPCSAASGVFRIWQRGVAMAIAQSATYNGGLGVEPPSGSEGRAPGRGVSPPEAEILFACERSIEAANSPIFSEICWKTAKNAPFHIKFPVKNFYGRAKGGASHRAPPLNTPLSAACSQPHRLSAAEQ